MQACEATTAHEVDTVSDFEIAYVTHADAHCSVRWSDMRAGIYTTLGMLMSECKLRGDSGTEIFMQVLAEAIRSVMEQWHVVLAGIWKEVRAIADYVLLMKRRDRELFIKQMTVAEMERFGPDGI
jgi:hypothetical protein